MKTFRNALSAAKKYSWGATQVIFSVAINHFGEGSGKQFNNSRRRFGMENIRLNIVGDYPKISPKSLIDPSAQIIGKVEIEEDVFIGPLSVIRADRRGEDGKVGPIRIKRGVNIHDGVVIHSSPGSSVVIGTDTVIGHGVTIYGPCTIGKDSFLAIRSLVYRATLGENVWLGVGAMVARATLASFTKVPMGSIIQKDVDAFDLSLITERDKEYMAEVRKANAQLRQEYLELRRKAEALAR